VIFNFAQFFIFAKFAILQRFLLTWGERGIPFFFLLKGVAMENVIFGFQKHVTINLVDELVYKETEL
jgi:hypothetical protein